MTNPEFADGFDILFNNISSNQSPGLDAAEKSFFLTNALYEVLAMYFNPKGNKFLEGYDGSPLRLIDFSSITKTYTVVSPFYSYTEVSEEDIDIPTDEEEISALSDDDTSNSIVANGDHRAYLRKESHIALEYQYIPALDSLGNYIYDKEGNLLYTKTETKINVFGSPLYSVHKTAKSIALPSDIFFIVNELAIVLRDINKTPKNITLQGLAILALMYTQLMAQAYKYPLKWQAWRLLNNDSATKADIIVGPNDSLKLYQIRYVKRPVPIVLEDFDDFSIEGVSKYTSCELPVLLHQDILERAVELAKAHYTGQLGDVVGIGLNSQTNLGILTSNNNSNSN